VPPVLDLREAIIKGINSTVFNMLNIPLPFLGVKGIRRFADKVVEWPKYARDIDQLAHEIIRINVILEDQGTGGGGFRYMYASFLREASAVLSITELYDLSKRMLEIGDGWREISLFASRLGKNRDLGTAKLQELGDMIRSMADLEHVFFKDLRKAIVV